MAHRAIPDLLLRFSCPHETPSTLTDFDLTAACCHALSGSFACGQMKSIDYRSGTTSAGTAIRGAIHGAKGLKTGDGTDKPPIPRGPGQAGIRETEVIGTLRFVEC